MLPSLFITVFSTSKCKFPVVTLLREAEVSTAPLKAVTRWSTLKLQKKVSFEELSEVIETRMAIFFPFYFLLLLPLKISSLHAKAIKVKFSSIYYKHLFAVIDIFKRVQIFEHKKVGLKNNRALEVCTSFLAPVKFCSKMNFLLNNIWQWGQRKSRKTELLLFT